MPRTAAPSRACRAMPAPGLAARAEPGQASPAIHASAGQHQPCLPYWAMPCQANHPSEANRAKPAGPYHPHPLKPCLPGQTVPGPAQTSKRAEPNLP